LITRK